METQRGAVHRNIFFVVILSEEVSQDSRSTGSLLMSWVLDLCLGIIAATVSIALDRLFAWIGKLAIPRSIQYSKPAHQNVYPRQKGNFRYLVVSKNAMKGQRLQLNLGSLLSSWFVWGAIAQLIYSVIYEEDEASGGV